MAEQKAKVVHGPGPRGMGGPRPKVENPGKLLKRIMAEVFQHYLPHCILVLICIVVSALANVQASLFLQTLIDDYIIPMTQQQDPSCAPLAGAQLGSFMSAPKTPFSTLPEIFSPQTLQKYL